MSVTLPVRKIVSSDPTADECASTISKWLAGCVNDHDYCRAAYAIRNPEILPARLIFVGSEANDNLKLIEGPQPDAKYVALSYCWGDAIALTLTSQTKQRLTTSISIEELPAIFQDLVKLTRHLELPYVWIDALCIVQDSPADWRTESRKMKDIYEQAWLVVSADRSKNTDDGFLLRRRTANRVFRIPQESATTGTSREIVVVPSDLYWENEQQRFDDPFKLAHKWFMSSGQGFESDNELISQNPCFARAWCLQEQILATRTVHFTTSEMIWECSQDTYCECEALNEYNRIACFEDGPPFMNASQKLPILWKTAWYKLRHLREPVKVLSVWWSCVEQYSSRKLSVQSDMLPAISGLARKFPEEVLGEYYAGTWCKDLPLGLLWYTEPSLGTHSRPSQYVAPSWSWASVIGRIVRPDMSTPYTTAANITSVECSSVGPDEYGQISTARIEIACRTVQVTLSCSYDVDHLPSTGVQVSSDAQLAGKKPYVATKLCQLDIEPPHTYNSNEYKEYLQALDIRLAVIADKTCSNSEMISGILLVPAKDKPGVYERVGIAQVLIKDSSFVNFEHSKLTII